MHLTLKPLTANAILPFVSVPEASPQKVTVIDAVFEQSDVPGAFAFSIIRSEPPPNNIAEIKFMERHPHSTQTFTPMQSGRWLIVVAPASADGSPDLDRVQAFVAGPHQSICIHRNVWHAPLTVLDRPSEFGMIMWKCDTGEDSDIKTLDQPIFIVAESNVPLA